MFTQEFEKTAKKKSKVKVKDDGYKAMSTDKSLMKKDDGSTITQMPELESDSHDYQKGY